MARSSMSRGLLGTRDMRTTRESLRDSYKRIKKERGGSVDGCRELIDLTDGDEREQHRIAGRFSVHCIYTDGGAPAEQIEFVSDTETCADEKTATDGLRKLSGQSRVKTYQSTPQPLLPPSIIDLTRPGKSEPDVLCENEEIYAEQVQTSSSDDLESSESSQSDTHSDGEEVAANARPSMHCRPTPSIDSCRDKKALERKIQRDIEELETRKPWRFVYRCLEIPFESTPRSDSYGFLFERWDDFWRTYGRAVWERLYWKPEPNGCIEYNKRKHRQSQAAKAFRELAEDLNERLGVKVVELVKSKPHPGWWYRPKRPVNLVRLCSQDSRLYGLHLSRCRERWPLGVRHIQLHCNALWCLQEHGATSLAMEDDGVDECEDHT